MARNLDVEYKMRMTQELKEKIVESAKEHNRSMNADIVARLEQSFKEDSLGLPPYADYVKSIEKAMSIDEAVIEKIADKVVERLSNFKEASAEFLDENGKSKVKPKTPEEFKRDYPDIEQY